MFITFEGIDGSGKTTLAELLKARFIRSGFDAVFIPSRGNSSLADRIRDLVQTDEFGYIAPEIELMLFSARYAQRNVELICPNLDKHDIVIADRYFDSNYVYQHYGRGLELERISMVCGFAENGLTPDCSVLVDIPAETAWSRIKSDPARQLDRVEKEGIPLLEKVRSGYLDWVGRDPQRWIVADGRKTPDELTETIYGKILANSVLTQDKK